MLTDKCFTMERTHPNGLGGVQRCYTLPNGYGLSLVNSPRLHIYTFAWEAAVITPDGNLAYDTPLTDDVEVFQTDEEANAFIERAIEWATTSPVAQ